MPITLQQSCISKFMCPCAQWEQAKRKRPSPEQRKVYCEVTQGDEVARALKGPSSLKGFGRTFLKGRWGGGRKVVISLCTVLWLADGETVRWCHRGSCYQASGSRRPEAVCSWSASTSSIWGDRWFPPAKQLRKRASDTVIYVLQRGAKAEGIASGDGQRAAAGWGSIPGRPHRVLLIVQSLSPVQLFATPQTAGGQASLSFTTYWSFCSDLRPLSRWCHPTIGSCLFIIMQWW